MDAPLNNAPTDGHPAHVGLSLSGLRRHIVEQPQAAIEDFFTVAVAATVADRRAPRPKPVAAGKRHLRLNIPVAEPELWNRNEIRTTVCALLHEMTGDTWNIEFRFDTNHTGWQAGLLGEPVETVSLFSGGLDSFSHAATLSPAGRAVLISHGFTNRLTARQKELRVALGNRFLSPASFQVRVNNVDELPSQPHWRTRPLLLLAAGVLVCAANGVGKLHCPQNGLMVLNPSKVPLWAASATAVHPLAGYLVNELLDKLAGRVRVVNPFAEMTKGEVCQRAVDAGWKRGLLGRTITCANPEKQPQNRFGNCGYCRHCLVRHAALVRVGGDRTEYREVYPPEIPRMAPGPHDRDLRSLRVWLNRDPSPQQLAPMPPGADVRQAIAVVRRARDELHDIY